MPSPRLRSRPPRPGRARPAARPGAPAPPRDPVRFLGRAALIPFLALAVEPAPLPASVTAPRLALAALAQEPPLEVVRLGGVDHLPLDELARRLGAPFAPSDGSATLRAPQGVLTVFAGSPDALWRPSSPPGAEARDVTAAAPVLLRDGRWLAPIDLLAGLLLDPRGDDAVGLPDGRVVALVRPAPAPEGEGWEVVELAPGATALRLWLPGAAGERTTSALIADVELLSLAFPEGRAEIDAFAAELEGERALYVVVTALAPTSWPASLRVEQEGRAAELRHPFRLRVLSGDAERVAPGAPVEAVALLPAGFDLRRPLAIEWGGVRGEIDFRR